MGEVTKNLIAKWGMAPEKALRREGELQRHFPEAWVHGFEPLIDVVTNDPKDRHVLAAAVSSHSELIVTYNRKHFPADSLEPWAINVEAPSTFLRGLYDLDAGLFVHKLHEQAASIQVPHLRLLRALAKNVPSFVEYFCEEQGIEFGGDACG